MRLFQRDYWKMSDEKLELVAIEHNIPPISRTGEQGEHWYTDRDRIIPILVARDTALRSNVTLVFSLIALLLSIASFLISVFRT